MNNLLTTKEVAQMLRVDRCTVLRWIRRGALEAVVLPYRQRHAYRVPRAAVEALLNPSSR